MENQRNCLWNQRNCFVVRVKQDALRFCRSSFRVFTYFAKNLVIGILRFLNETLFNVKPPFISDLKEILPKEVADSAKKEQKLVENLFPPEVLDMFLLTRHLDTLKNFCHQTKLSSVRKEKSNKPVSVCKVQPLLQQK